jgi:uncharacterized protein YcgL (UPF0745 family)
MKKDFRSEEHMYEVDVSDNHQSIYRSTQKQASYPTVTKLEQIRRRCISLIVHRGETWMVFM